MNTTAGLLADAKNRAELLTSRFTALNDSNPGFSYQGHLRGVEKAATGGDSVTTALVDRPAGLADLERLLSDDETFLVWHLRLGHPLWWIGLTVQYTTTLLKKIVSDLTDEPQDGPELPSAIELLTEPGGIQQFLAGAMPAWAYSREVPVTLERTGSPKQRRRSRHCLPGAETDSARHFASSWWADNCAHPRRVS